MIDAKDVVTLKMPFPDISSKLAITAHMYICRHNQKSHKKFIKCQTFKNSLVIKRNPVVKQWIKIDKNNYPFLKKKSSLIDCDKEFHLNHVKIPRTLIAGDGTAKIDDNLLDQITHKLISGSKTTNIIGTEEFLSCNPICKKFLSNHT